MRLSGPPAEVRSGPARGAGAGPWAATAFAACSLAAVALCAAVVASDPLPRSGWRILLLLAPWGVLWALGVVFAFRLPPRAAVPAVLVVGTLLRLVALSGPPTLSDDLHRYAWDGRVQAAGIDPYRHPPTAPALRELREPWLWPDEGTCAEIDRNPGCTRLNRPAVRTIYPPVAQAWFSLVYRLGGIDARHKAWQVAALAVDLALLALLVLALREWGRDRRWVALYALSPVPVVELVNNGHVDGLAALFVVAALVAGARRRRFVTGVLVGAAGLVKLYPLLLLVALAGIGRGRERLAPLAWGAAGALAVAVAGYLPHVVAVGWRVLGYLPGYLREEQYDRGGRYLLAGLLGLPAPATAVVAAAALAAVTAWVLARRPGLPHASTVLLGGLLLAVTPVQPWYAVLLLAVASVAAAPVWTLVAAAGYPYFFAVILDAPEQVAVGRLSYGVAFLAVAVVAASSLSARRAGGGGRWRRRWRR